MERISVGTLAKELGNKPNDVMRLARDVDLKLVRVASTMTPGQADKVRARHASEQKAAEQARTRVRQAPPPQAPAPQLVPAEEQETTVAGPLPACHCCGIAARRPPYAPPEAPVRCAACGRHYPVDGENEARVLDRLNDHDARLRRAYAQAYDEAAGFEERMKSALHSRDSWRGALVEVALAHEETGTGGCRCGAKESVCFTWKRLEAANRGIMRRVEDYGAMKDDERDAALYRRDHWDRDSDG